VSHVKVAVNAVVVALNVVTKHPLLTVTKPPLPMATHRTCVPSKHKQQTLQCRVSSPPTARTVLKNAHHANAVAVTATVASAVNVVTVLSHLQIKQLTPIQPPLRQRQWQVQKPLCPQLRRRARL
jgi:hypothetical protein